ncbi:uncharacterized protein LOC143571776 [Bidens hawaiensis]|uniref:uncharacterized protein LOC143571776 n=1 Tax=Bidens hawaiensis TaxID=980011 RepID=UPI00404A19BE
MVKFQFQNFTLLKNEAAEEMINRFCHLMAEMSTVKMEPSEVDKIDMIKNALPSTYSTFLLVLKENSYFFKNKNLTAEGFINKLEEREYDMKCQKSLKDSQDPTLYGGLLPLLGTQANLAVFETIDHFQDATADNLSYGSESSESETESDDTSVGQDENSACIAKIEVVCTNSYFKVSVNERKETITSVVKTECAQYGEFMCKLETALHHNDQLVNELTMIHECHRQATKSLEQSTSKIKILSERNHDLKAEVGFNLVIIEKHFQEILKLRTCITQLENEIFELKNEISKFQDSSFLLNEIIEVNNSHQKNGKAGLGFLEIPPPFKNDYSCIPETIDSKTVEFDSLSKIKTTISGNQEKKESSSRTISGDKWILDSGCSRHITDNLDLLTNVKDIQGGYVAFAGNQGGMITKEREVSNGNITSERVNYCEKVDHNLLSMSQICDKKYTTLFTDKNV